MTNYVAIEGQSIYDVCLNTYMSLDYLIKLMNDNDFDNLNAYPFSGQVFQFDETLIADKNVTSSANYSGIIYSTAQKNNGSVLGTSFSNPDNPGPNYINTQKPEDMYYSQTLEMQFTSGADGTTSINLPQLIGCNIVQITKEIQPLKLLNFSWNMSSGTLTLLNGNSVDNGQTLFIIYTKIITS